MGITTAGESAVAKMIVGSASVAAFDYLALGDSNTAFADTQTALQSEITGNGLARAQDASTAESSGTGTVNYSWTASGTETIREIGVFNASSGGTMLCRQVLTTPRSMTSGATYEASVDITVTGA